MHNFRAGFSDPLWRIFAEMRLTSVAARFPGSAVENLYSDIVIDTRISPGFIAHRAQIGMQPCALCRRPKQPPGINCPGGYLTMNLILAIINFIK